MATPTSPGIPMAPTAGSVQSFLLRRRSPSRGRSNRQEIVMPGLARASTFLVPRGCAWMAGTRPAMTPCRTWEEARKSLLLLQLRQRARPVIVGRRVAYPVAGVDGVEHRGILGLILLERAGAACAAADCALLRLLDRNRAVEPIYPGDHSGQIVSECAACEHADGCSACEDEFRGSHRGLPMPWITRRQDILDRFGSGI